MKENKTNDIMKVIVRKPHEKEASNPWCLHCTQCKKEVGVIPGQGFMPCVIKDRRSRIIDLTGHNKYYETSNNIKYYVSEEETAGYHKLTRCLGCWSRKQSVDG